MPSARGHSKFIYVLVPGGLLEEGSTGERITRSASTGVQSVMNLAVQREQMPPRILLFSRHCKSVPLSGGEPPEARYAS